MLNLNFYKKIFIFAFCIMNLPGCAPSPYVRPAVPQQIPGIYHRVEAGQTLWKISKMYSVDLDELVKVNRIQDSSAIETGEQIFIPQRQRPQAAASRYSDDDFIWPLKGKVITSFGQVANNMLNKGVNIRPFSNADIVASRNGKVIFIADDFGGYGKTLILDHGDGFSTVYARNSVIFPKTGESVQKGAVIAQAGSAGRDTGNTYLHFEVRKGHIPQNPYYYLP